MYYPNKYPVLSTKNERDAFKKLQKYKKSNNMYMYNKQLDFIVKSNVGLVIYIANKLKESSFNLDDLIQQGMIGLMVAIDKFDLSFKTKFSTYAFNWISAFIRKYKQNNRHPVIHQSWVQDTKHRVYSSAKKLKKKLNREPTAGEISKDLKMPIDKVKYFNHSFPVVRLDMNFKNSQTNYHDVISDKLNNIEEEKIITDTVANNIKNKISKLTDMEKFTVMHLFGLCDGVPKKSSDIGKMLNLTRERIRQIKQSAFNKMGIKNSKYITRWLQGQYDKEKIKKRVKNMNIKQSNNQKVITKYFFDKKTEHFIKINFFASQGVLFSATYFGKWNIKESIPHVGSYKQLIKKFKKHGYNNYFEISERRANIILKYKLFKEYGSRR